MTHVNDIKTPDITHFALNRHTVKAFDPTRKIDRATVEKLKTLLRYSPSSTNAQPWYFIMASTEEGKERVATGTDEKYPFNSPSIRNASHVVVFASRLDMTEQHLGRVLDQEDEDGRYDAETSALKAERRAGMDGGRRMFMNLHKQHYKDVQHWMDKQVYLNVGQFLLGAAALGVDTTPMEGFEIDAMDEEFGLREKGFSSLVVVCLGYSDEAEDYNSKLPKSRLPFSEISTEI